MHPNPAFRKLPAEQTLDFARSRGFGILTVNAPDGPLAAHIPFILSDDGLVAGLHLARSNAIARALAGNGACRALLAVAGPDSYISPDWYGADDQVPTWNYIAAHLRGTLSLRPESELRDLIDRQSAHFEALLLPKTPWTSAKMTPGVMDRMMRQIVPFRLDVDDVQGTWKLGQNKPDAVRIAAAEGLELAAIGAETAELARLMRDLPG